MCQRFAIRVCGGREQDGRQTGFASAPAQHAIGGALSSASCAARSGAGDTCVGIDRRYDRNVAPESTSTFASLLVRRYGADRHTISWSVDIGVEPGYEKSDIVVTSTVPSPRECRPTCGQRLNAERENARANTGSIASRGRRDARARRGVCLALRAASHQKHSSIGASAPWTPCPDDRERIQGAARAVSWRRLYEAPCPYRVHGRCRGDGVRALRRVRADRRHASRIYQRRPGRIAARRDDLGDEPVGRGNSDRRVGHRRLLSHARSASG